MPPRKKFFRKDDIDTADNDSMEEDVLEFRLMEEDLDFEVEEDLPPLQGKQDGEEADMNMFENEKYLSTNKGKLEKLNENKENTDTNILESNIDNKNRKDAAVSKQKEQSHQKLSFKTNESSKVQNQDYMETDYEVTKMDIVQSDDDDDESESRDWRRTSTDKTRSISLDEKDKSLSPVAVGKSRRDGRKSRWSNEDSSGSHKKSARNDRFRYAVILANSAYKSALQQFECEFVKLILEDNLDTKTVPSIIRRNKRRMGNNCLWLIVTGILDVVDTTLHRACKNCLHPLASVTTKDEFSYPDNNENIKQISSLWENVYNMFVPSQGELGQTGIVALLPPIPNIVIDEDQITDHKNLHAIGDMKLLVANKNAKFALVANKTTLPQIENIYRLLYNGWTTIGFDAMSYWIKPSEFLSYVDNTEKHFVSVVSKEEDIRNSPFSKWSKTLSNFLETLSTVKYPWIKRNPFRRSAAEMISQCISQFGLSDSQNEVSFNRVVVIGNTLYTEALQKLTKGLKVHHLDENMGYDDDGIEFLKQKQKEWPMKTLFIILSGISEIAEPIPAGPLCCIEAKCKNPVLSFVYKNHQAYNLKHLTHDRLVERVTETDFNFAVNASTFVEGGSAIFLAPIMPVKAIWSGVKSGYTHKELHYLNDKDPSIPLLIGDPVEWSKCANMLENKWLERILEFLPEDSDIHKILKTYEQEKGTVLEYFENDYNETEAKDIWSKMMFALIMNFLGLKEPAATNKESRTSSIHENAADESAQGITGLSSDFVKLPEILKDILYASNEPFYVSDSTGSSQLELTSKPLHSTMRSLSIQNVETDLNEAHVKKLMKTFGEIEKLSWPHNDTNESARFISVDFYNSTDAHRAQRILSHLKVFGDRSEVKIIGKEAKPHDLNLLSSDKEMLLNIQDVLDKIKKLNKKAKATAKSDELAKENSLSAKIMPDNKAMAILQSVIARHQLRKAADNSQVKKPEHKYSVVVENVTDMISWNQLNRVFYDLGALEDRPLSKDSVKFTFQGDISFLSLLNNYRFPDSTMTLKITDADSVEVIPDLQGSDVSAAKGKIDTAIYSVLREIENVLKKEMDVEVNVFSFKTRMCRNLSNCSIQSTCHDFHDRKDRRRCPISNVYSDEECTVMKNNGVCKLMDSCPKAHSTYEKNFHFKNYRTILCLSYHSKGVCDKVGRICPCLHPDTPEMLYNENWKHLYVEGLKSSLHYLAAAIRNLFRLPMISGLRVLFVTPSANLAKLLANCVKDMASVCLQKVVALTDNENTDDATVIIATSEAIIPRLPKKTRYQEERRHRSNMLNLRDLKALIIDDAPNVFKNLSLENKHVFDFGKQDKDLNIVAVAEKVGLKEVNHAKEYLGIATIRKIDEETLKAKVKTVKAMNKRPSPPRHGESPSRYARKSSPKNPRESHSKSSVRHQDSPPRRPRSPSPDHFRYSEGSSSHNRISSPSRFPAMTGLGEPQQQQQPQPQPPRLQNGHPKNDVYGQNLDNREGSNPRVEDTVPKFEFIQKLKLYKESPEMHPEFHNKYKIFMEQYMSIYPTRNDPEHKNRLWKQFWNELIVGMLKDDYIKELNNPLKRPLPTEDSASENSNGKQSRKSKKLKQDEHTKGIPSLMDIDLSLTSSSQVGDPSPYGSSNQVKGPLPFESSNQVKGPLPFESSNKVKGPLPYGFNNQVKGPSPYGSSNQVEGPSPYGFSNQVRGPSPYGSSNQVEGPSPYGSSNKVRSPSPNEARNQQNQSNPSMSLEDVLTLLEEVCPAVGILGPALNLFILKLRSANESEIKSLIHNKENNSILQPISTRFKELSESNEPLPYSTAKLQLASIQSLKLLEYPKGFSQKSNQLYKGVDINKFAHMTYSSRNEPGAVILQIKNIMLSEGVYFNDDDIKDVFLAVTKAHFEMPHAKQDKISLLEKNDQNQPCKGVDIDKLANMTYNKDPETIILQIKNTMLSEGLDINNDDVTEVYVAVTAVHFKMAQEENPQDKLSELNKNEQNQLYKGVDVNRLATMTYNKDPGAIILQIKNTMLSEGIDVTNDDITDVYVAVSSVHFEMSQENPSQNKNEWNRHPDSHDDKFSISDFSASISQYDYGDNKNQNYNNYMYNTGYNDEHNQYSNYYKKMQDKLANKGNTSKQNSRKNQNNQTKKRNNNRRNSNKMQNNHRNEVSFKGGDSGGGSSGGQSMLEFLANM